MHEILLSNKELEAVRHIRNSIIHKGRFPSVRELMTELDYRSPRSAAVIIEQLLRKRIVRKKANGNLQLIKNFEIDQSRAQTIDVPLIGTVACGLPILAEENIEAMIPVSVKLAKPPNKYFILKVKGDSMNEREINDGDMVLIKQQNYAEDTDLVVALIDDEATIKELKINSENILLIPKSTNKKHQPIILTKDFMVQGIVISTIPI